MIVLLLESQVPRTGLHPWEALTQRSEFGNTERWGPQVSSLEIGKPEPTEVQLPVQQCSPWMAEPGLLSRK